MLCGGDGCRLLIFWRGANMKKEHVVSGLVDQGALLMSTHASVLVDSVGPPSAEVCRTAASFP
jgi:hypothetical protein